jgi:formylmethanofuran dehydrogenase subunit A
METIGVMELLTGATTTGASGSVLGTPRATFSAYGTTTAGAGAATIKIQVSNDKLVWIDMATITLTLATTVSGDGFATADAWGYVRTNVTAISGTGASVTVLRGA